MNRKAEKALVGLRSVLKLSPEQFQRNASPQLSGAWGSWGGREAWSLLLALWYFPRGQTWGG